MTKMSTRRHIAVLTACAFCALAVARAEYRTAGNVVMEYESLNGGGVAFATNGVFKLGGTMGQNNFVAQSTNTTAWAFTGFWRAESACALYPTWITAVGLATNSVAIEFGVTASNTYSVLYAIEEDGGLPAGDTVWTNLVDTPFVATSGMGGTAVVYDDLSTATNAGRYYLIRCD